jgi:peptidoglycan/LPS O-acetylase OafA/YrhL
MRAVAVLCVVLVHTAFFGGGLTDSLPGRVLAHLNIGVTIFFLISGFLLYRPFIAHRGGGPRPPTVSAYGKRRFLRIYPAYWLVLTVLLVAPGLPSVDYSHVWPMYSLTHTLPIAAGPVCSSQVTRCGLAQTWSLVAELTFYIVLPVYVVLTERLTRGLSLRAWLVTQALTLTVLATASLLVEYVVLQPAPLWLGWTVVGNVLWFALGMGLAIASIVIETRPQRPRILQRPGRLGAGLWLAALAGYVALCLWLAPSPFFLTESQRFVVQLAFGVIALLLLAPVVLAPDPGGVVRRIAGGRLMMWLGLVSYGIFLWHYPVVLAVGPRHGTGGFLLLTAVTLLVSIACAAASYYVLERPVMRLKYRPLRTAWPSRRSAGDAPGP